FLIKSREVSIKNNEELSTAEKRVDGENFILPTLLHEIQPYIQTVELWSDGGNLKDGFIYIIQDFLRKNKMVDSFNAMSRYDKEKFLLETFKNYPTIAQRFYNYLMFLGEVEARTVEKNRTLSQEEIKNAKDISHEDNAIVKDTLISYLSPLDNFYYSLAMKEMLLGFNEFERPNNSELENNKDIYDDELKKSLDKAIDFYNSDIRFSKTTDSEGRELTVEQAKYFKDSKVRDELGNLLVVYHGTTWDFNIFDKSRTNVENDFGQGFY